MKHQETPAKEFRRRALALFCAIVMLFSLMDGLWGSVLVSNAYAAETEEAAETVSETQDELETEAPVQEEPAAQEETPAQEEPAKQKETPAKQDEPAKQEETPKAEEKMAIVLEVGDLKSDLEKDQDINLTVGKAFKLTMKAPGTPKEYLWQYQSADSEKWTDFTNQSGKQEKTATLERTMEQEMVGQKVRCVVKYDGEEVNSFVLTLKAAKLIAPDPVVLSATDESIEITKNPVDYKGLVGTVAEFSVEAQGPEGKELTYRWCSRRSGKDKFVAMSESATVDNTAGKSVLKVDISKFKEGAEFYCKVSVKGNSAVFAQSGNATLSPITITVQPQNTVTQLDVPQRFSCKTSEPVKAKVWKMQFKDSIGTDNIDFTSKTDEPNLKAVKERDGALLWCELTDSHDKTVSSDKVYYWMASEITAACDTATKYTKSKTVSLSFDSGNTFTDEADYYLVNSSTKYTSADDVLKNGIPASKDTEKSTEKKTCYSAEIKEGGSWYGYAVKDGLVVASRSVLNINDKYFTKLPTLDVTAPAVDWAATKKVDVELSSGRFENAKLYYSETKFDDLKSFDEDQCTEIRVQNNRGSFAVESGSYVSEKTLYVYAIVDEDGFLSKVVTVKNYGGTDVSLECKVEPAVPKGKWTNKASVVVSGTVETGDHVILMVSRNEEFTDLVINIDNWSGSEETYEVPWDLYTKYDQTFYILCDNITKGTPTITKTVTVKNLDMEAPYQAKDENGNVVPVEYNTTKERTGGLISRFVSWIAGRIFNADIFTKDKYTVLIAAQDDDSGIQKVECAIADQDPLEYHEMTLELSQNDKICGALYSSDEPHSYVFRITDKAGNVTEVGLDDSTVPPTNMPSKVEISAELQGSNDVWTQTKDILVTVRPENGESIDGVKMRISRDNAQGDLAVVDGSAFEKQPAPGSEGTENPEMVDTYYTYTYTADIPGTHEYSFIVRQNTTDTEAKVAVRKIDRTLPTVETTPKDSMFIAADGLGSFQISGDDQNDSQFDESASGVAYYVWTTNAEITNPLSDQGNLKKGCTKAELDENGKATVAHDGKASSDYYVWAVDNAGNVSKISRISVLFDGTLPEATEVTLNGAINQTASGNYANTDLKLDVSATDPTVENQVTSEVRSIEAYAVSEETAGKIFGSENADRIAALDADDQKIALKSDKSGTFTLPKDAFNTTAFDARSVALVITDNAGNVRVTMISEVDKEDALKSSKVTIRESGALEVSKTLTHSSDTRRFERMDGNDTLAVYYGKDTVVGFDFQISDAAAGLLDAKLAVDALGKDTAVLYNKSYENENAVRKSAPSGDETIGTINTSQYDDGPVSAALTAHNNLSEDLGSNPAAKAEFIVDKTEPSIKSFTFTVDAKSSDGAQVDSKLMEEPVQAMSYGYFFKENTVVTVDIDDNLSGISLVEYYLINKSGVKVSEGPVKLLLDAASVKIDQAGPTSVRAQFTVPGNFKGQVFVRATDMVDNTCAYQSPSKATIVETAVLHNDHNNSDIEYILPNAPASVNTGEKTIPLYADNTLESGNHPIQIKLWDYFSGLDMEKTVVDVNSTLVDGSKYSKHYKASELVSSTKSDLDVSKEGEMGDKDLIVEALLVLPLNGVESNAVEIVTKLVDRTGHASEKASEVAIDKTDPSVTVKVTQNGQDEARNSKYFNVDRTATITVADWNVRTQDITITTGGKIGGWSQTTGAHGIPTYTATVVYDTDGDYKLEVRAKDAVGHVTGNDQRTKPDYQGSAPTEFTVDKTKPVINIAFDNNNVRNGKYYNAARTATVTINEHNFSATVSGYSPVITPTAKIAEGRVSVPGVNGWGGSGDTHTATVRFAQDGDYTLTADYTDLAGNKADTKRVEEFTVDTTKPTLEITGVTANTAYKGDVAPSITYHDINYDSRSAGITIKGVKHPQASNLNGTLTNNAYGGTFTTPNIQVIKSNDDVYTIVGSVSDLAGNSTEQTLTFSVNRFGSTYAFDDATEKYLKNFFATEPQDIVIREINVDTLKEYSIVVTNNGDSTTLEEGKDYTVKTQSGGWKEYVYTIKASVFDKEGPYDIVITSRDAADNINSNRTVKDNGGAVNAVPVSFVIDKTKPSVVIDGVEPGKRYHDQSREVLIRFEDNVNLARVEIFIDNVKVAEYSASQLQEFANGEIPFTVDAKNDFQTLKVIATDAAGNTSTTLTDAGDSQDVEVSFLLTNNLLVQYIHNPWALGGTGVVAAAILFLLFKRKKDDEEENAQKA